MPTQNTAWDMSQTGPAQKATAITPQDSVDLVDEARALYIGVGGDVKVTMVGGDDLVFGAMVAGQIYPIAVTKVWSGATSASSIVALR